MLILPAKQDGGDGAHRSVARVVCRQVALSASVPQCKTMDILAKERYSF